jgi:hypothetical protein
MLFGAVFGGLQYPVVAASFMATWVLGRVLYTYGYVSGASRRYAYGGQLHLIGAMCVLSTSSTPLSRLSPCEQVPGHSREKEADISYFWLWSDVLCSGTLITSWTVAVQMILATL